MSDRTGPLAPVPADDPDAGFSPGSAIVLALFAALLAVAAVGSLLEREETLKRAASCAAERASDTGPAIPRGAFEDCLGSVASEE